MRGKPSTEIEHLEAGLGQAADPYMIGDLMSLDIKELAARVRMELRYTAISMIRAGRVFMAIKKKLGHGRWEDFVADQRWSWEYVRASMRLLEVVAQFPHAIHLPPGRPTHALLRLPMSRIDETLGNLPPEAVKKLTPWDIEQIYNKQKIEAAKSKPRRKPAAPLPPENTDEQWMRVKDLHAEAVLAMANLVAAAEQITEWKPEYFDEVLERKMVRDLGRQFDRVIALLHPEDEMRKRGAIED